jgi:hypothetical protein
MCHPPSKTTVAHQRLARGCTCSSRPDAPLPVTGRARLEFGRANTHTDPGPDSPPHHDQTRSFRVWSWLKNTPRAPTASGLGPAPLFGLTPRVRFASEPCYAAMWLNLTCSTAFGHARHPGSGADTAEDKQLDPQHMVQMLCFTESGPTTAVVQSILFNSFSSLISSALKMC